MQRRCRRAGRQQQGNQERCYTEFALVCLSLCLEVTTKTLLAFPGPEGRQKMRGYCGVDSPLVPLWLCTIPLRFGCRVADSASLNGYYLPFTIVGRLRRLPSRVNLTLNKMQGKGGPAYSPFLWSQVGTSSIPPLHRGWHRSRRQAIRPRAGIRGPRWRASSA